MTEEQKNFILDMASGEISEVEFLDRYPVDLRGDNSTYISQSLDKARAKRDEVQLECILILLFRFGEAKWHFDILCQLLQEDWHMQHENIVLLLKDLKNPKSVDCLYWAALANLPYLDYDESHALAVKSIFTLDAIDTDEARDKLRLLTKSENAILRDNAQRQLNQGGG